MQPTYAAAGPAPLALVFGASGYIGTNLVPRLLAHGFRVRAAARNPTTLEARDWPGVARIAADALDPQSLPAALAGVDVAFYLVHSMAAGRDFGRLDVEAAGHFARAAEAAGIGRIVYLGGLIPPDARSEHLVSRRESGDALRRGAVPVTETRADMMVGPGLAARGATLSDFATTLAIPPLGRARAGAHDRHTGASAPLTGETPCAACNCCSPPASPRSPRSPLLCPPSRPHHAPNRSTSRAASTPPASASPPATGA